MFAFDPTISTGNIITVLAIVGGWAIVATKKSFDLGAFKVQFDNLSTDVAEIKRTLDDRQKTDLAREKVDMAKEIAAVKADILSESAIHLVRYRLDNLERETIRARANIHRVASAVHVRLMTLDEVDSSNTPE